MTSFSGSRHPFAATLFTILVALTTASAFGDDHQLRVMSFNIRYGTAQDGADAWPKRRSHVAEVVRKFAPDLMGTQETLPFQAEELLHDVPGYTYVGWSRDSSANGEQCGLFVRTARFEVLESGQFWLSETPNEKFSKSWDSSLPRVATWAKLQERNNAQHKLLFINTHFDHRGVTARRESAALVARRSSELAAGLPVIITGDFNCDEGSEPWLTLTAPTTRLTDSFRSVYPDPTENEGTFHGFSGKPGSGRIDWILVSPGWKPLSAAIDRSEFSGRFPSDHFPVTTVLSWPAGESK
jgi:endonuclease/exonuclease/phosphatase family metal-dependent hydrolase